MWNKLDKSQIMADMNSIIGDIQVSLIHEFGPVSTPVHAACLQLLTQYRLTSRTEGETLYVSNQPMR